MPVNDRVHRSLWIWNLWFLAMTINDDRVTICWESILEMDGILICELLGYLAAVRVASSIQETGFHCCHSTVFLWFVGGVSLGNIKWKLLQLGGLFGASPYYTGRRLPASAWLDAGPLNRIESSLASWSSWRFKVGEWIKRRRLFCSIYYSGIQIVETSSLSVSAESFCPD